MKRYHGTDDISAQYILEGLIDVTKGGGELGQGFYVGNLAHKAATWAYHKGKIKKCGYKVIQFDIDNKRFYHLKRKYLTRSQAFYKREQIKMNHHQRVCTFGVDAVCAPVVGGRYYSNFTQIKFEGHNGQDFINATYKKTL